MTILLDSCSYNCQNVGDLAMLKVAVSRLRELWPTGSIRVLTNAPDHIVRHCGALPTVPVRGRRLLLEEGILGRVRQWLPRAPADAWSRLESKLRLRHPQLFNRSLRFKSRFSRRDVGDVAAFLDAIDSADAVVINGAGIMTDAFKTSALGILATLELAQRRGLPTAMFGQGLGPIGDPELKRRAAEVLPFVTMVAVRESRGSVALLHSLGVAPDRIAVTGDDAIELAFKARRADRDNLSREAALGINVRVAPYAGVDDRMLTMLKEGLRGAARTHRARMIPIPIAHHGGGMDLASLSDLAGHENDDVPATTPELVIERVASCRVVVTGSYHGAVFALAQGIPAVALVNSAYYKAKMSGLAHQFSGGCAVVELNQSDASTALQHAIDRAWTTADEIRPSLLDAARQQIVDSRAAYRLFQQRAEDRSSGLRGIA
jgi:colanic acid/amylovoran biosynthesis protein